MRACMCVRACVLVRTCARLRVRVRSHVQALHVLMPEHASKHMRTDMHMHMLHDNFPAEWPAYTFAGTTRASPAGQSCGAAALTRARAPAAEGRELLDRLCSSQADV